MNYIVLIYENDEAFATRRDVEKMKASYAAWVPYLKALKDAGVYVMGAGLQPPETATTLRIENGKRLVQDGPFADTKEQLGGFLLLDVPDLDTALDWAAKIPQTPGRAYELRPHMPPMS